MATKNTSTTDLRIGLTDTPAELHIEVAGTQEEVAALITKSIDGGSTLTLTDVKGRQTIIVAAKIAFVEVGSADARKVGFTTV